MVIFYTGIKDLVQMVMIGNVFLILVGHPWRSVCSSPLPIHTEGPETYEKMLSITSHQRDAN